MTGGLGKLLKFTLKQETSANVPKKNRNLFAQNSTSVSHSVSQMVYLSNKSPYFTYNINILVKWRRDPPHHFFLIICFIYILKARFFSVHKLVYKSNILSRTFKHDYNFGKNKYVYFMNLRYTLANNKGK